MAGEDAKAMNTAGGSSVASPHLSAAGQPALKSYTTGAPSLLVSIALLSLQPHATEAAVIRARPLVSSSQVSQHLSNPDPKHNPTPTLTLTLPLPLPLTLSLPSPLTLWRTRRAAPSLRTRSGGRLFRVRVRVRVRFGG